MTPRPAAAALHPTATLLAALIGVVAIVSLSSLRALAAALTLALLTGGWLAGGVRPLAGALWALPFGGLLAALIPFVTPGPPVWHLTLGSWTLVATAPGLLRGLTLLLRLLSTALLIAAVVRRLGSPHLLTALDGLRVPTLFRSLVAFTLRYASVLADESRRMAVARRARGFSVQRGTIDRRALRTYGELLGVLFIRARERSERVYLAMLSRGYALAPAGAQRPPLVDSPTDVVALILALGLAVVLKILDLKFMR